MKIFITSKPRPYPYQQFKLSARRQEYTSGSAPANQQQTSQAAKSRTSHHEIKSRPSPKVSVLSTEGSGSAPSTQLQQRTQVSKYSQGIKKDSLSLADSQLLVRSFSTQSSGGSGEKTKKLASPSSFDHKRELFSLTKTVLMATVLWGGTIQLGMDPTILGMAAVGTISGTLITGPLAAIGQRFLNSKTPVHLSSVLQEFGEYNKQEKKDMSQFPALKNFYEKFVFSNEDIKALAYKIFDTAIARSSLYNAGPQVEKVFLVMGLDPVSAKIFAAIPIAAIEQLVLMLRDSKTAFMAKKPLATLGDRLESYIEKKEGSPLEILQTRIIEFQALYNLSNSTSTSFTEFLKTPEFLNKIGIEESQKQAFFQGVESLKLETNPKRVSKQERKELFYRVLPYSFPRDTAGIIGAGMIIDPNSTMGERLIKYGAVLTLTNVLNNGVAEKRIKGDAAPPASQFLFKGSSFKKNLLARYSVTGAPVFSSLLLRNFLVDSYKEYIKNTQKPTQD